MLATLTLRSYPGVDVVQLSATGPAGSLSGPGPLVEGELPPGTYTLAPANGSPTKSGLSWSWECEDGRVGGEVTLVGGTHTVCHLGDIGVLPPTTAPPATTAPVLPGPTFPPAPQTRVYQPGPTETRTYEEFVEQETVAATVGITFDGIPPDDNDKVYGLVEGEVAELLVELTVVGSGDEGEALPEGVEDDSIALIAATNRVTVTCPDEVNDGDPADCNQFNVRQPNPREQDYADRTFEFEFTPLEQAEIRVVVVVEGVLEFVGDGVDPINAKKITKEFGLDIIVSPQRETWNKLRAEADAALASLLRTDVPPATRGVPVEVTSTFTFPTGVNEINGLTVDLLMDTEGRAEISPGELIQSGQTVARTWTVTPFESGPLGLNFWLEAESEYVDDTPYVSGLPTVFLQVSEPAAPPRGTVEAVTDTADGLFSAVVYIAGGLAVVLGLLTALGAKTWWQKRNTLTAAAADTDTNEPPTE